MSSDRIDIIDTTSVGANLVAALRSRGMNAQIRTADAILETGSDAAILVLSLSVTRAREVLHAVRAAAGTRIVPIILFGGEDPPDPAFSADAFFPSPVNLPGLLSRIERFLRPSQESSGDALVVEPTLLREPTLELGPAGSAVSAIVPMEPRESTHPGGPTANISARLSALLTAADQRVFPTAARLTLSFGVGPDAPEELVPDELLQIEEPAGDHFADDPSESFTFVGAPPRVHTPLPTLHYEQAHRALSDPPAPEGLEPYNPGETVQTLAEAFDPRDRVPSRDRAFAQTTLSSNPPPVRSKPPAPSIDSLSLGSPTADGSGRRGELSVESGVVVLMALVDEGVHATASFQLATASNISIVVHGGRIRSLEGPVERTAIERLRASRRLAAPSGSSPAWTLQRAIELGQISQFELDRELRLAREDLLLDIVTARAGVFDVRPADEVSRASEDLPFRASLYEFIVDGARRRFLREDLLAITGNSETVLEWIPDRSSSFFERSGIESEVVSFLRRFDGAALSTLLEAAPPGTGFPGLLMVALIAGAVSASEGEAKVELTVSAAQRRAAEVRRQIECAHRLAVEGDYFAILGLSKTADEKEIAEAYIYVKRSLEDAGLARIQLEELEALRDEALSAVEEAYAILRVARWRETYRAALQL